MEKLTDLTGDIGYHLRGKGLTRTHDTLFDFPKITYVEEGNEL